jgi:hypothetical protein
MMIPSTVDIFTIPAILLGVSTAVGGVFLLPAVIGGWRRLAAIYATDDPVPERALYNQWAQFGEKRSVIIYRRCLTAGFSDRGLYLALRWPNSLGHHPILIPWHAIQVESFSSTDRWGCNVSANRLRVNDANVIIQFDDSLSRELEPYLKPVSRS